MIVALGAESNLGGSNENPCPAGTGSHPPLSSVGRASLNDTRIRHTFPTIRRDLFPEYGSLAVVQGSGHG